MESDRSITRQIQNIQTDEELVRFCPRLLTSQPVYILFYIYIYSHCFHPSLIRLSCGLCGR